MYKNCLSLTLLLFLFITGSITSTAAPLKPRVKAQYYVFALIFLIFDVESVFLYPLAVAFEALTLYGVLEGILFVLILAAGLIYAWNKGALEWI